jgi:hypothetical protein
VSDSLSVRTLKAAGFGGLLLLLACGSPKNRHPVSAADPRTGPFRPRPETIAAGTPADSTQIIVADFDGNGLLDTLCLAQRAQPADGEDMATRHIRVTIIRRRGGERVSSTLIDEVWATEGRVMAEVSDRSSPPTIAVGVPDTDERLWYHWDGAAFRVIANPVPGYE